ncbi:MAG: PRC-barrel domain-containing protein, partial [Oricola sp.]
SMTTAATPRMETVPVAQAQIEASQLIGMNVVGANNETVGEVSDVLIDDGGKVEAFVIDVGGFLGMNEKPVAVSMDELQVARAEGSNDWTEIKTGLTKEALESQAAYSEDQYKADKNAVILIAPVN